jgi:hypothetical protein
MVIAPEIKGLRYKAQGTGLTVIEKNDIEDPFLMP